MRVVIEKEVRIEQDDKVVILEPGDVIEIEEKAETGTFKCPDCGKKVLIATSYCLSCKKKVKGPDKKKEDDDEKDKEDKEDKNGKDKDDKDDDEKKKDKDKDKDDKDKEDEKKKK